MARRTAPPSTVVLFVRHGRTPTTGSVLPGRAKGLHLSDEGHLQADRLAKRLASSVSAVKVDAVYSSPLERTRQTASHLAQEFGEKVQIDRGLLECDFGEWTGAAIKDLQKLPEWNTVQHYPSGFRFPGGESFVEMQSRIVSAVAKLAAQHTGGTIVVVSHADPIKAVLASAAGIPLDLFQRIHVSPCSVSAVRYGATPFTLCINCNGDLEGLLS